jgi:hypothetical protein
MEIGRLPLYARLGLAAIAGLLGMPAVALYPASLPYKDFVLLVWAALFGILVLAPYAWNRSFRIARVLALGVASALIYYAAVKLAGNGYGVGDTHDKRLGDNASLIVSGGLGALLSTAAVMLIANLRCTVLGWIYVLVAGVAGGAAFIIYFSSFFFLSRVQDVIAESIAHTVWQVLVCLALYYSVRERAA